MTDEKEILTPKQRHDFNGFSDYLSAMNIPIDHSNVNGYLKGYNQDNPDSDLKPEHIGQAISEIDNLKNGVPFGSFDKQRSQYIAGAMGDAYKNGTMPRYPITKDNDTNLEKELSDREKKAGGGDPAAGRAVLYLPPDTKPPVKLQDERTVSAASGQAIKPGQTTGSYDRARVQNVIKAAKAKGVDPNTALAVALQETHLGNLNPENIGNVYAGYGKAPAGFDQSSWELASFLKEKMEEAKKMGFSDEAHWIQNFNGMGKLAPKETVGIKPIDNYYGIKVSRENPLDMKKNPVYGKTIIDLRDNVIKKNKDIQSLIQGA